jgi:hypothetical protein
MFEGVVGNGYQGDIAIDDVSVKAGPCPGQGEIFIVENQPYSLIGYGIRPVGLNGLDFLVLILDVAIVLFCDNLVYNIISNVICHFKTIVNKLCRQLGNYVRRNRFVLLQDPGKLV